MREINKKDRIIVFIPFYNCENQITRVLDQFKLFVLKYVDEILLVNNKSTDCSEKKIIEYGKIKLKGKITLLRNNENYNLGGSHKVAFGYAIKNNYDYIIVLHGDDQGDINDLLPYLKSKEYRNYDALLGSRFIKGSLLKGYSKSRIFGNKIYNVIFSIGLRKKIKDLGSGLNIYKVSSLKDKYYLKYPDRLTFNCYMLLAAKCYNQKIMFFPISWREEDQVSNVKMLSQAFSTLKIPLFYFLKGKKYLEKEHREKIITEYNAEVIFTNRGEK